jgi:hypothetical protein
METTAISTNETRTKRRHGLDLQNILLLISASAIVTVFMFSSKSADTTGLNPEPSSMRSISGMNPTKEDSNDVGEKSVNDVVTDALAFKNLLTTAQQSTLQLTYSTSLARKWSNLPCGSGCRNGLQLGTNLSSAQYQAAMKVISDALSAEGYTEFHDMNIAEAYLHANGGGNGYDSTLRWIAYLNTPSETGPWMLQFGGHHYAANIAFNNGHVIGATPFFMGLEPKTFTYQGTAYDPLGDEKTALATALSSLTSTQLSSAQLSTSFSDVVMSPGETNGGTATFPAIAMGQAISALSTSQKATIMDAIEKYIGDIDDATHAYMSALYESELNQSYISYHGSGTSGSVTSFLVAQGDYVRISGPHVWIEFSCQGGVVIQNQIHYHTIWRDRVHDYGVDLTGSSIDENGTTGIAENGRTIKLDVYPNPATDNVTAKLPTTVTNATVVVFDQAGRAVETLYNLSGVKLKIDTDNLAKGTYILKIADKSNTYTSKFSKQ